MVQRQLKSAKDGSICGQCKSTDIQGIGNPQAQEDGSWLSTYQCTSCGHVGHENVRLSESKRTVEVKGID